MSTAPVCVCVCGCVENARENCRGWPAGCSLNSFNQHKAFNPTKRIKHTHEGKRCGHLSISVNRLHIQYILNILYILNIYTVGIWVCVLGFPGNHRANLISYNALHHELDGLSFGSKGGKAPWIPLERAEK